MLKGGSNYRPGGYSGNWYFPQALELNSHNKYFLMSDRYERASTVGFRCVVDYDATPVPSPPTPPTPTPPSCTTQDDTDYLGGDYRDVAAATPTECCYACRADAQCFVGVFFGGRCYLKDASVPPASSSSGRVAVLKGTPSPTPPTPPTPPSSWEQHVGVNCYQGHGAVPATGGDPGCYQGPGAAQPSLSECKNQCDGSVDCESVIVMTDREGGGPCCLIKNVVLDQCVHDSSNYWSLWTRSAGALAI